MRIRNEGTGTTTHPPRRVPSVGSGLGALRDEMNHLMEKSPEAKKQRRKIDINPG